MVTMTAIGDKRRLSPSEYLRLCTTHLLTYWKRYTAPVIVLVVMQLFIRVDVNYTSSLPDHVFITIKGWTSGIEYGDYVAYRFPSESPLTIFRKGDHMVKIIIGKPGDEVRIGLERKVTIVRSGDDGSIAAGYMGGTNAGISKAFSKAGKPLEAISPGIIPPGRFYAYAPHPDSLDSRYKITGLIETGDMIGRTFPIF